MTNNNSQITNENRQYIFIVNGKAVDAVRLIYPWIQAVEVMGLPVKDEAGNEFTAFVTLPAKVPQSINAEKPDTGNPSQMELPV